MISFSIYKTICLVRIRFHRDLGILNTVLVISTYKLFDRHYVINPDAPVYHFDCSIIGFLLAE